MKKKSFFRKAIALSIFAISANQMVAQQNVYTTRFLQLREKIHNPANGYFSAEGAPYHSPETLMCEAPDYGHETTSEAYSYWIWLEAMYGKVQGDWKPLNDAWTKMETQAIPTNDLQPTVGDYKTSAPATYAGESALPSNYPSPLMSSVPVGQDPVSGELTSTYGNSYVYGMHWLFDVDNFYGYGNKGDGVSKPSYINTFQRGVQESVWETVPHPSWEDFKWGSNDGTGFLKLFISESSAPSKQWRYTNAPDADARVVQAMYWATQWAKEQGLNPSSTLPLTKAKKMGDYLRLAMFDKYFKPMGVQNLNGAGATGYQSAHYLMSWYYAWGGPLTANGWAWRIGCSHNHFGYQNPVAAYALSATSELTPASPNAGRDWGTSLTRQLELYQWLQSSEGAIAGGATNSWNGKYDPYPAGTPTFYQMAYVENPVYEDPGSNTWFGFQAWSMERVAEYYYMTGNARAKGVLDKWVTWVKTVTRLLSDGSFEIPSEIGWSGKPNTWVPTAPVANNDLHVNVVSYGKDLGIAAALAKTLTYYAAATQKYGTLDTASRDLAKEVLDRMWTKYYDANGKGVAVEEKRGDYSRFFTQEVYIPSGWTGKMANGDVIKPGVKFADIRSKYKQDPDYQALLTAYNSGTAFTKKYHRFWAQVDIALANAEYGRLFGGNIAPAVSITAPANNALYTTIPATVAITATASDTDGTVSKVEFFKDGVSVGSDATAPYEYTITGLAAGSYALTAVATDNAGATTTSSPIAIKVGANALPTVSITAPANNATFSAPATVAVTATAADSDGTITKVEFFKDGVSVGSDATAPYEFSIANLAVGTYSITAVATDNLGATATSAAISIKVNANVLPTVSITAPVTGATFAAPATVAITATASDSDGTIAKVEFYNGSTLLGSSTTAPYTYNWTGVAAGTYSIKAIATDNLGGTATSNIVSITVNAVTNNCNYGTPLASNLPTINKSFSKVYKLGSNGPSLSNVTNFSINWSLENNGLWQMSFNTNNGVPTWWIDLRSVSTAKFKQANPEVTFTNSGFPGLDGAYWATIDNGNFVLVSKTGGYTLYFSNDATAPSCTTAKVSLTATTKNATNTNNVRVYPNPFRDVFNISMDKVDGVNEVLLFDQSGRVVLTLPKDKISSSIEINKSLPRGIYLLKVKYTNNEEIFKIVKE